MVFHSFRNLKITLITPYSLKWVFKPSAPTGVWLRHETLPNCSVLQCQRRFDPGEHRQEIEVLEKHCDAAEDPWNTHMTHFSDAL